MILDQTLGSTIGAALFGGFADAMYVLFCLVGSLILPTLKPPPGLSLYGIATSQCFTFFQSQHQRKDSLLLKGSVGDSVDYHRPR